MQNQKRAKLIYANRFSHLFYYLTVKDGSIEEKNKQFLFYACEQLY